MCVCTCTYAVGYVLTMYPVCVHVCVCVLCVFTQAECMSSTTNTSKLRTTFATLVPCVTHSCLPTPHLPQAKGLHFKHTDNFNFWTRSMESVGLPKIFYPITTDCYDRKNMPKVIYCIHALRFVCDVFWCVAPHTVARSLLNHSAIEVSN